MFQPPTDNLYKFLAIFGLILFGFSWYMSLQRDEAYSRAVARWNADWEPLIGLSKQADEDAREQAVCAIVADKAKEADAPPTRPSEHCAEVNAARSQVKQQSRNLEIAIEQLRGSKATLDHLRSQALLYRNLAMVLTIVSIACIVVGFRLWYTRVQRYIDAEAAAHKRK